MSWSRRRTLASFVTISAVLVTAAGGCAQSNTGSALPQTSSITASPTAALVADKKAKAAKIALILPLGGIGEPAQIARGMKQAAEMALFEANNPAVQLIAKDDGGTPQGAMAAADAAIAEGAEIILGPLYGKSAAAIAPIANKAGIAVVSFSNDPTVAGHGVYLMSFLATEEVHRVVSYAAGQGKRRFAALIPDTAYGKTVEPAFRTAVAKAGGQIVAAETFSSGATSLLTSAKKVVQAITDAEKSGAPVDALFVPAGPDQISQLGPLLNYAGLTNDKLKLLGTSAWDGPIVSRDEALIGGWYAASDPGGWTDFAAKYRKNFGTTAPRLATLSYDAMSMALTLAANAGTDTSPGRFSAEKLTRTEGFSGVDGPVRLTAGGFSQRDLAVLEVQKYSSAVIEAPAPVTAAQPQAMAATQGARPPL
jgi:branched-chain amino acid transport system substrate-binding protein